MKRGGPLERRTPLANGTKGLAPGKPLARGTGLARGKPLDRGTAPLRSTTPLPRAAVAASTTARPARKAAPPDPVTPATRAAVRARSGGVCEGQVTRACTGAAAHVHHRKLRRFGDHRVVNLLDLCHACHEHVHKNPTWSYDHGFLVRSHDDPETIAWGLAA